MYKELGLIFLLGLIFTACVEQRKDNNIKLNPILKSEIGDVENTKFKRVPNWNNRLHENIGSCLFLETDIISLDTLRSRTFEIQVGNIGIHTLSIQRILVSIPFVRHEALPIDIPPNTQRIIQFDYDPSILNGYQEFQLSLINNSIDIEKKVNLSGFFMGK